MGMVRPNHQEVATSVIFHLRSGRASARISIFPLPVASLVLVGLTSSSYLDRSRHPFVYLTALHQARSSGRVELNRAIDAIQTRPIRATFVRKSNITPTVSDHADIDILLELVKERIQELFVYGASRSRK